MRGWPFPSVHERIRDIQLGWRGAGLAVHAHHRHQPQQDLRRVTVQADAVDAGSIVNLTSSGVDAFKATLSRVPAGEMIFWWQGLPECDVLAIPGPEIVAEIRLHCVVLGLDLQGPGAWSARDG